MIREAERNESRGVNSRNPLYITQSLTYLTWSKDIELAMMRITMDLLLSFSMIGETVVPQKRKTHGLKIYHRFHFQSALKRMSVIVGHTPLGSTEVNYMASVKGAPETLKTMVSTSSIFFTLFNEKVNP